ncbi:MAG: CRISPR-associated protein Cas4 [Sulfolobales archaeon]
MNEIELDLVREIYSWRKKEKEKHVRDPKIYYVTDLVRCSLKREYEVLYPDLSAYEIFYPPFVLGDFLHKGLQNILREIFGERVSVEVEGEKRLLLPEGSEIIIRGRSDGIIKLENGKRVGVEIKSSRTDYNIPMDHHIDQAKIYNWLFDLEETILLYATYDRITQYRVREKISEEEILNRIKYISAPRYSWECSYCPFASICPFKKKQQ